MSDVDGYERRHVDVDGTAVGYFVAGMRAGTPPLLLVHGTGGSTEKHFSYLLPMLSRSHTVVSVDLAPRTGARVLEVEDLQRQVSAVIADADLTDVTLVGYSLGAAVALAVAAEERERVPRLVLISGWMRTDGHQRFRNDLWRRLRGTDERAAREFMTFTAMSPRFLADQSAASLEEFISTQTLSPFVDQQMALNRRIDLRGAASRVIARTLIVAGTHDQMVPAHHSAALFGAIDDARLAEIDAGHASVAERPAELMHLINDFHREPARVEAGTLVPPSRP